MQTQAEQFIPGGGITGDFCFFCTSVVLDLKSAKILRPHAGLVLQCLLGVGSGSSAQDHGRASWYTP